MNNRMNKKTAILLATGLLISSLAQIIARFYPNMPDSYKGFFTGAGIGIMLLAIMKRTFKKTRS